MTETTHRSDQSVSARPWWPGRTDEVRRVADRCRKRGWPDGELTVGEIAAKTGSDVWIALDALDLNEQVDEVAFAMFRESTHRFGVGDDGA